MEKLDLTYKIQVNGRIFTVSAKELENIKSKGISYIVLKTSRMD